MSRPPETKYFEFGDLPAYWGDGKFPVVVTASGEERRVDSLMEFMMHANPITREEFEDLVRRTVRTGRRNTAP